MKNVLNSANMAKRMNYTQPKTEVFDVCLENLMLTVSTNPSGHGGGVMHAPSRGKNIPF